MWQIIIEGDIDIVLIINGVNSKFWSHSFEVEIEISN